jgi:hypothetical protein
MKHHYRGFPVLYYPSDNWLAFLYPPESTDAMSEIVRATRAEGEEVLLNRARARIDAELDGNKNACDGQGIPNW